jgi:hypothetical protein
MRTCRFSWLAGWARTGAAVGLLPLVGCATFWDDVSSPQYRTRFAQRPFQTMFTTTDPVVIARTSTDGDERARALGRIREPKSGTPQHDEVLALLTTAATRDNSAICRMAAIDALGEFRSPQAVTVLVSAYQQVKLPTSADNEPQLLPGARTLPTSAVQFPAESACAVRCRIVTALGKTQHADAAKFLVEIAQQMPAKNGNEGEVQRTNNIRVAAIRALGDFRNQADVSVALTAVLRTERDVAVRSRAAESYASVTGKAAPAELSTATLDNNIPAKTDADAVPVSHRP